MTDARIYPIDTDALHKGSVITPEEIQAIFHVQVGTSAYCVAALRLRNYITDRFAERNETVTVISDRNALRILTDPEAAEYNAKRFRGLCGTLGETHIRNCGVDTSALDDKQKRDHERVIMRQSVVLTHMREGWKAPLLAHERQTPKLING
jgi:hypothetical protein